MKIAVKTIEGGSAGEIDLAGLPAEGWERTATVSVPPRAVYEYSTRYSAVADEFVMPVLKRQFGKPMDYQFEALSPEEQRWADDAVRCAYDQSTLSYQRLRKAGVSREDARSVLPLGTQTHLIASSHLKGWLRFLAQRTEPHAQDEIREDVAAPIEAFLTEALPVSMSAWIAAGRRAL
mgnify:CR=1 FL=1